MKRCIALLLGLTLPVCTKAAALASVTTDAVFIDTTVITQDVTTVKNQDALDVAFSASCWDVTCTNVGTARIYIDNVEAFSSDGEGTWKWIPVQAGRHLLRHSNGRFTVEKYVNVIAPTVTVSRGVDNLCVLTASDGESAIRYTTDGSEPNGAPSKAWLNL